MSTDHNGSNQNLASAMCINNCGFYGSSAFEGMCSKCYKDIVKNRNNSSSTRTVVGSCSGLASSTSNDLSRSNTDDVNCNLNSIHSQSNESDNSKSSENIASSAAESALQDVMSTTPNVETASPTISITSSCSKIDNVASIATESDKAAFDDLKEDKKPKKNRCQSCKKKVGLTGFECRCGGLYCSTHRYSDMHECTFNYKEMAQEQIRKNNPIVVADKVKKI